MKIAIDRNVPIPAYQQVVDGIAGAIARGDLGGGARLPSVRMLAVDLGLNVNTVARAYRDLERAGVISTRPGMGTFVAPPVASLAGARLTAHRPIPATGAPLEGIGVTAPLATSWRELLQAARALASAEGVSTEEFVGAAREAARTTSEDASVLVAGTAPGEAADLIRSLPASVAAQAVAVDPDELLERVQVGAAIAVLSTFPAQGRVRGLLGERAEDVALIPVETEYTEATVRSLSTLPATGKIALVTVEKANWDHEANDVMKIIGRSRWLKMVLLEHGEKGLEERLDRVDVVLHVPRARSAVEPFERADRVLVELAREVTPRTRERLLQVVGPAG
jgi:GntR family transcriptional regulator